MLASVTSWLTPSFLFILLNIVIGTIFLTSRFTSSRRQHHNYYHQPGAGYGVPPLARTPSLLERVKSIDISFYKYGHQNHEASFVHPPEPQYIAPPPLERAPSFLERVKSIDFFHKFADPNHDVPFVHQSEPEHTAPPPPPLERAPSFLDRVKSINSSLYKFAPSYPESDHVLHPDPQYEAAPQQPDFPQPTRSPSFLERVKSIDFTSFYRSDSVTPNPETELIPPPSEWDSVQDPVHVNRSKSEKKVTQRRLPEKMKKSASENSRQKEDVEEIERRRPQTASLERKVSIGDVDAKADDFINKFKQQLKLQRLDSLLRYKETPEGK